MRQAFVHEALLAMGADADERAPGASVTFALCGDLDHKPPCPLSAHFVRAEPVEDLLHIRVLFAADPETVPEVRRRIELALSGQWPFPDGFATPWQVRGTWPGDVAEHETDHAQRLIRS